MGEGYTPFVLALVALATIVGVGLNVLVGLAGQVSIGHIGFYAIGAYAGAVLTLHGVNFWVALVIAGVIAGAIGALLALPAIRVSGPYLAMMTIAFAFIVHHITIEWREVTGGQNGLMNIPQPALGAMLAGERGITVIATLLAGLVALFLPPPDLELVGHGDGGGARFRDRRPRHRLPSRHRQDHRLCAVRRAHRRCRRPVCGAVRLRRAGFASRSPSRSCSCSP